MIRIKLDTFEFELNNEKIEDAILSEIKLIRDFIVNLDSKDFEDWLQSIYASILKEENGEEIINNLKNKAKEGLDKLNKKESNFSEEFLEEGYNHKDDHEEIAKILRNFGKK